MKGDPKLINTLNVLLSGELAAVIQYMVHAEMCEDWGYVKLGGAVKKRAIDEMKHAEKLIERIIFLEGHPMVATLDKIDVGQDVSAQLTNDCGAEFDTIRKYNDAIALAGELKDHATRAMLQDILKDEDGHIDEIESLLSQIDHMNLQNFLTMQAIKK